MDITVYLPDDLGQRAKDSEVNLSRMLRDALTAQFEEEEAMEAISAGATVHELKLEDKDGHIYNGTITGKEIAGNDRAQVFVTDRNNVVVYDPEKLVYYVEDERTENLEDLIGDQDVYLEAMHALGRPVTIDLEI